MLYYFLDNTLPNARCYSEDPLKYTRTGTKIQNKPTHSEKLEDSVHPVYATYYDINLH